MRLRSSSAMGKKMFIFPVSCFIFELKAIMTLIFCVSPLGCVMSIHFFFFLVQVTGFVIASTVASLMWDSVKSGR